MPAIYSTKYTLLTSRWSRSQGDIKPLVQISDKVEFDNVDFDFVEFDKTEVDNVEFDFFKRSASTFYNDVHLRRILIINIFNSHLMMTKARCCWC